MRGVENEGACERCKLALVACVCAYAPNIESNIELWILSHQNELSKSSNTAKLALHSLSRARLFVWHRKEPDPQLLGLLGDEAYRVYLLYPKTLAKLQEAGCESLTDLAAKLGIQDESLGLKQKIACVIIDGTWQQAAKIYRLSPYLHSLNLLELPAETLSNYSLRRSQKAGNLCTAEVVVELLEGFAESSNAQCLADYLAVFMHHYLSAREHRQPSPIAEAQRLLERKNGREFVKPELGV